MQDEQPGPDDIAFSGEELEEYCKKHGLCNLCAQTKTHKRVFRLKKKNQWQPLTVQDKDKGEYSVYKGYCVQPGCFTHDQARRLLGEVGPDSETTNGEQVADDANQKSKKGANRLLGRGGKNKANAPSNAGPSFDSMTGMSGISSYASKTTKKKKGSSSRKNKKPGGLGYSSEIRRDDDDVSVAESQMTSASGVRRTLHQLLTENAGSVLDLSSTRLHHNHITEMVSSLSVATTLQTLILENCRLNDNEIEVVGTGLAASTMVAPIQRLSLRSNRMGNRGAVSLQPFFAKTAHLLELDLSKNQIGSRGAVSTLHAFRDNPACPLKMVNLAHNEIWDPDDGSFFASNTTLQLFNLEGNFIHDEGIEAIMKGVRGNRGSQLRELYLGWNGIGDEGCIQIATMLQHNKTLEKLGLGENDITSIGARALLSALGSNKIMREITGLYHNQIDRKFVIVAIKRLLQSHVEKLSGGEIKTDDESTQYESALTAMETLAEPLGATLPPPEEGSEGSLDWEEKLYAASGTPMEDLPGVPLGNFDHRAGDTDEDQAKYIDAEESAPRGRPVVQQPVPPSTKKNETSKPSMNFKEMPPAAVQFDRITVIQSAPLAYFNRETTLHVPIPLRDFDFEAAIMKNALQTAEKQGCTVDMEVEPGHPDRLRAFFQHGSSRVLHLSSFGHPELLAFENGAGYLETIAPQELKSLVKASHASAAPLELVVVSSFHSGRIGKAFIEAGVPHVVCCHHTEIFRDKAAAGFCKNLYRGLADNKSLKQAFHMAQEAIRVEEISKHVDRYVLLPRKPAEDPYHEVPILFTKQVPPVGIKEEDGFDEEGQPTDILPRLPKHFIGREADIYEVLEAMKVDDVVRVGGPKGIGKTSLVAATCRYVNQRKKTFQFDDVFWFPPPPGARGAQDTLLGDLCELMAMITNPAVDLLEDENAMECQARVEIGLEERRSVFAIDERKFGAPLAAQNLETFLSGLLNNAEIKVKVLIVSPTPGEETEETEEDTVTLKPLDFKSSALLFGEVSRFITANGCPAAQSPDEFAALMVPPSVAKLQDQTKFSSGRRTHLMEAMGGGIPFEIIKCGKTMKAGDFIQLIGIANTPEVHVDSSKTLEDALRNWTSHREDAVGSKNFLRAADLTSVLRELDGLQRQFPSLENLIKKEQELQRRLNSAMSRKEYTQGNTIKREILALKRVIMQEKRATPAQDERVASDRLAGLQAKMSNMMRLANNSFSEMDTLVTPEVSSSSFRLGSAYHNCEVAIYPGNVVHFDPGNDLGAVVCWTNECCDMSLHESGKEVTDYGGPNLATDISSLPGITKTEWGLAKCGTGNAVIVGPGNYDDLRVHCVVLAVGPLAPTCATDFAADDEDSLHYVKVMMRSCIRSALILAKHSQVQSIAFPTLTTKMHGVTYDQTLLLGLKILVEEAKHSDLNNLHIVAKNEEESKKLIAMAIEMGLIIS